MKTYKGASTNQNKGHATHGSFKNSGQKPGKKALVRKEKEMKKDPVQARLRKISKAMFAKQATTHNDISMRAQLNG